MAVEYKDSMSKDELLNIAVKSGITVDGRMTKKQIMSAIDDYNATQDAQDGADSPEMYEESPDTPEEEQALDNALEDKDEYNLFVYAGPTLPRGRLKENTVFRGTFNDVTAYLSDVLEEYPQVEKLIVPSNKLGEFAVKVKNPGNIAYQHYVAIVSVMHGKKEV